jgi:hypothetical protein
MIPGPFEAEENRVYARWHDGPYRIATCNGARLTDEAQAWAARFFALAPDMHAALRDMVAHRRHEHLDCTVEPYAACAALVDKLGAL